ncbi:hypothetical protein LIER_00555 [Lithospermum erythrorhizon]|uniref:Transposase (putative) gypsy type domain-containing protein n=1 Tax=Lithospermum erythrorhizon TaxID=34254 RepID=A0AAV3NHT1_LITER
MYSGNSRGISRNPSAPRSSPPQGSIPKWRPDSPVTVMDVETLAFFRLWTSVGAEVTYGNLTFSQTHDPFANIVLPHEIVQGVAGQVDAENLEEIGGSEGISTGGTISPKPLSVVHPSSSTTSLARDPPNIGVIRPIPQTTFGSQPGKIAKTTSTIPTIIRDSLPVSFSEEDLRNFRQHLSIPSEVEMCLPRDGDQVSKPVVDPSCSEGSFAPRWTTMYIESLNYGARFPFAPFTNDLLIVVNRAPRQRRPVGWLTITIFIVACRIAEIEPTMPLFFNMYNTSHSGTSHLFCICQRLYLFSR